MIAKIRIWMNSKLEKVALGWIVKNLVKNSQIQAIVAKIKIFPQANQRKADKIGHNHQPEDQPAVLIYKIQEFIFIINHLSLVIIYLILQDKNTRSKFCHGRLLY